MNADERFMRFTTGLMALLLYFFLAAGLNHWRGAVDSGFGSFDDEPSHLVTGLMVKDYVAQGLPGSPMAFAEEYYLHYPKVGLGQWPPVFYGIEAAWMLTFGESTRSIVMLLSFLTACVATLLFLVVRDDVGYPTGLIFGLLFLLVPLVQVFSSVVMTEVPVALFCLAAAWQFGLYLEREKARNMAGFALFATLAILTKGSAIALAFLPPIAALLAGRMRVFLRPATWIGALVVGALCAPWYWFTLPMTANTWSGGQKPSWDYAREAAPFYVTGLFTMAGVCVLGLAVAGFLARAQVKARRGRWAATAALIPSVLIVLCVVPSGLEERNLVLLAPAFVAMAAWGVHWLTELESTTIPATWLASCLVIGIFGVEAFELPVKNNRGYSDAARVVLSDEALRDSVLLIASDPIGEGLFVSDMALRERRPGHTVLRGSKVLGHTDWLGRSYEPVFTTADEMRAYLEEIPVGIVAFDSSMRQRQRFEHHELLLSIVTTDTDRWEPLATFDVTRDGYVHEGALRLWRQRDHESQPVARLTGGGLLGRPVPFF